jgi:hypothetical protein
VLYGILSPELYLLLVRDRSGAPGQREQRVYGTLCAQLCDGGQDPGNAGRTS